MSIEPCTIASEPPAQASLMERSLRDNSGRSSPDAQSAGQMPAADLRREILLMKALQNPVTHRALRCFADPQQLLESGMAFWSSQVVLTAVDCGLFTLLAAGPQSADQLTEQLGWHPRAASVFLDSLVAMDLLRRDSNERYANTRHASWFLDRNKPSYIGGLMELSSRRLYDLWSHLGDLLRTGQPQATEEQGENEFFSSLYQDPAALRNFLAGMTGISTGEAMLIAARFPWKRFRTFLDVGAAQGALPVRIALTHRHRTGASYDLPPVQPVFEEYVASFDLSDRLSFIPGDMNHGPFPAADVISFGHVFHGYGEAKRRELLEKASEAIPPGGAVIVYDAMIDARERRNRVGLLSSLNIMLETREGVEATTEQCKGWFRGVGVTQINTRGLVGPSSMVYGFKPGTLPREA